MAVLGDELHRLLDCWLLFARCSRSRWRCLMSDGVVILLSLVDAARPLSGAVLHWLKIYFCLFSLIARFHACLF